MKRKGGGVKSERKSKVGERKKKDMPRNRFSRILGKIEGWKREVRIEMKEEGRMKKEREDGKEK